LSDGPLNRGGKGDKGEKGVDYLTEKGTNRRPTKELTSGGGKEVPKGGGKHGGGKPGAGGVRKTPLAHEGENYLTRRGNTILGEGKDPTIKKTGVLDLPTQKLQKTFTWRKFNLFGRMVQYPKKRKGPKGGQKSQQRRRGRGKGAEDLNRGERRGENVSSMGKGPTGGEGGPTPKENILEKKQQTGGGD